MAAAPDNARLTEPCGCSVLALDNESDPAAFLFVRDGRRVALGSDKLEASRDRVFQHYVLSLLCGLGDLSTLFLAPPWFGRVVLDAGVRFAF